VGGVHSSGSSVSIQLQTPALSQSSPFSKLLQKEAVCAEYPAQHPSAYCGDGVGIGVGSVVGGRHSSMSGSSVSSQLHSAAITHINSSSMVPQ